MQFDVLGESDEEGVGAPIIEAAVDSNMEPLQEAMLNLTTIAET